MSIAFGIWCSSRNQDSPDVVVERVPEPKGPQILRRLPVVSGLQGFVQGVDGAKMLAYSQGR